jgi:malonyl-CoA O-methyltransferase
VIDARRGYRLWAERYPPLPHNALMELEQQAMLELLPDAGGRLCLDVATGSGRYCLLLQQRGARRVLGVDFSGAMLAQARRHGLGWLLCASLSRLPLAGGRFDVVTCGLALGHTADLPGALLELARVLRPGGAVVYSDFHPAAARAGLQRTFRDPQGKLWALEHHAHDLSAHAAAAAAAGLELVDRREPGLPDAPLPGPLVLALLARKGG